MSGSANLPNARRGFLHGRLSAVASATRPPWALPEAEFLSACTRCNDCLSVCPSHILHRGDGGYPAVEFSAGECSFCAACRAACTSGALHRNESGVPWTLLARIAEACLAMQRVECRVCGERCDSGAIRFLLQPGSAARPVVEPLKCNGCGACFAPCPTQAVRIAPRV